MYYMQYHDETINNQTTIPACGVTQIFLIDSGILKVSNISSCTVSAIEFSCWFVVSRISADVVGLGSTRISMERFRTLLALVKYLDEFRMAFLKVQRNGVGDVCGAS